MATIESKKVEVNASPTEVFQFVHDLRNLKELLPQDKISEWEGHEDRCSFKVAGAYKIGLEHKSAEEPTSIVLKASEGSPIDFDLHIALDQLDGGTAASMVSNLNVNPFMKMMVEKPLKSLFDYIADQLKAKFG